MSMKNITLITSICLYLISLSQDCYSTDFTGSTNKGVPSILALLTGWLGLIGMHGPAMSWLANPLMIASWISSLTKSNFTLPLSIAALAFMLSFLFFKKIMVSEAGHISNITNYNLGYWLWLASAAVLVAGNIYMRYISSK